MGSSQTVHFVYWCRLASGLSGPLHHTRDFIRSLQCHNNVGFITVFANNPHLKEMEKNGEIKVIIAKEARRFPQFFFLLGMVPTLLRMLRLRRGSGLSVFYFRYTSFLLLPVLLRALGQQNIYLELNGIPNQDLLEYKKKPLSRYLRKRLLFAYDRILFQSVLKVFTVCEVFKKNLLEKYRIARDVSVIPNGYFPEEVPLLDRSLAKHRLGLDQKTNYSIYVGHLSYYEGVEFLVQAFLHLCNHSELKDNVLLILGVCGVSSKRNHEALHCGGSCRSLYSLRSRIWNWRTARGKSNENRGLLVHGAASSSSPEFLL